MIPALEGAPEAVALIDAASGETISFGELCDAVAARAAELADLRSQRCILPIRTNVGSVADYLALRSLDCTVMLIDPTTTAERMDEWAERYEPAAIVADGSVVRTGANDAAHPPEEAVLLPTSGSTGNPRFVRLSDRNLHSNADQIVRALRITPADRALAHLPLFYSFGLSVLHSHLLAGASSVLADISVIRPEFYETIGTHSVTTIPVVPYTVELLLRTGFATRDLPSVNRVIQAGGALSPAVIEKVRPEFEVRGIRLWVMYGQTEATARMTVLEAADLEQSLGSVGRAVPDATIRIDEPDERGEGEIVFCGPNVMLGYAESRSDLNTGDELGGELRTGDLGRIDDAGRLWITGRLKRIAKVFGTRVNLDDLQLQLAAFEPLGLVSSDDGIVVVLEGERDQIPTARTLERVLSLPPRSVTVKSLNELPRTASNKVDYEAIRRAL